MGEKTILVWFRNDLRVHDNEILLEASRKADKVLPVYIFDPYYFKTNPSGNPKTGNIRAKFLLESVADLRSNLQKLNGDLIIRIGNPAELLPQLAEQYQVSEVYHHREVAYEETAISEQVEAALWKIKLNLKHFIGHTLYHKEDLPFPIKDIPDSFSTFKKKVERDSNVRPCLPAPEKIKTPEIADAGELPTLQQLGLSEPLDDPRATFKYKGGETEGLVRLNNYLGYSNHAHLKNGRAGTVDTSSKLSAWLAVGCISPRQVYKEVVKHEQETNTHTNLLILELLWRDYFRFMFKKHGQKYYKPEALNEASGGTGAVTDEIFENWKKGNTGVPFIDAVMHELSATGYIHNFGRQMVAGYLVRELNVNWVKGAAYFEEKLIDYSPASNWGNWAFIAGMAHDAKDNRYFNLTKKATELDTKGGFVETWAAATDGFDKLAQPV